MGKPMSDRGALLNGEEAIAEAAIGIGLKMVTGYPGSPGGGVLTHIIRHASKQVIHVEWSTNEKVATETAIGASIAGAPAMVCVKSVGLNSMIDPLMAINLSPLNAALVIIVGDDPGGYGSQNDQDSRPLSHLLEMPWLEPADPRQAWDITGKAFQWSQQFRIPVFIRITRSFSLMKEKVDKKQELPALLPQIQADLAKDQFVPHPGNAVEKHRNLQKRLLAIGGAIENSNIIDHDNSCQGEIGIIACGHTVSKLQAVLEEHADSFPILQLASIYPLPNGKVLRFLSGKTQVMVLEEHHSVIGTAILEWVAENHLPTEVLRHNKPGELFRWEIAEWVKQLFPVFRIPSGYIREKEDLEHPRLKSHCLECRYGEALDLLDEALEMAGLTPFYSGDPGCLVTVTDRLHAKMAMGGAVALASGFTAVDKSKKAVALFGDSSFFHTTLPAICNASYQGSGLLMVLLDNGTALTTGSQAHPGSGKNIFGESKQPLSYEAIALSCGADRVWQMSLDHPDSTLLNESVRFRGLGLLIITIPGL